MKTLLTTLWLCGLIACSATAQERHVRAVRLPDSTVVFQATRTWMEYAVESMETRTWQDEVIAGLQNEITAADDQLYYRDMAIANLEDQVASLQDELGAVRDQAALADRTVTEMYSAARRMKTTRALAGVAALAAAILYVLK